MDNIVTLLIVAGAVAYWFKYGKKAEGVDAMAEISELTSTLSKWEILEPIGDFVDKLSQGKTEEAKQAAKTIVKEFANDKEALNKLEPGFKYQMQKRLEDPQELEKIKAEVSKASQAHREQAQKVANNNT